ncbi:dipeptidyl peptidase 4-like isoform X3 [Pseudoliparis swirei]|uniref:dipeptidyl peptidase 4-like isoform X3 n=1 Tax=Pseudoliparis swirei TaxID=2059687 RepID=UPI0024BE3C4A|nr:dipeptidyl peptidase 4-like isoform X3 [Pseudoliparis swirei]
MVSIAKVILGVVGLGAVVTLIAVPMSIFLKEGEKRNTRSFTLEDAFNSSLKPKSVSMKWISDYEYLNKSEGSVFLQDVVTGASLKLLSKEEFSEKGAYDYQLSADRAYVAFMSNRTKRWRHSFTATYSLYDLKLKQFLQPADIPEETQYFSWAPEGNKLAYVWKNNVYIKTGPRLPSKQVTFNGVENLILNGIPDWVYEEEMFSSNQGLWWSPGGKYVAYVETNDTDVHNIEYSWYGENQYPSTVSIRYPKPGTPNPTVKLFVVDADNTTDVSEVAIPEPFGSSEHYLATVTWATDESLAVQWLKRVQNHLLLQIYTFSGTSWVPGEHLKMKSPTGWIGRFSPSEPVFDVDKNSYYLVMSNTDGYKHLHHVVGEVATALTSGKWEIIDILKVTADSVYYSSNQDGGRPGGRNVYRWTTQDPNKCLTCALRREDCQYNSAYFSHNASFYRLSCSGPGIPFYSFMDTRIDKEHIVLEENKVFSSLISDIQMPSVRRHYIPLGGFNLWYQMLLPPGFDESKKYPLLLDVYAGPCSQKVDFIYRVGWSTYLASTEKVIVASFDGRGSGYQGDKLMHAIYKGLGTHEVEDQITAVREFIKLGYIDKDKVAIWGWSYGGYVASMALGSGSGVFKCGMAVAPVSKWEYYGKRLHVYLLLLTHSRLHTISASLVIPDSIYTERYMMQPSENNLGYSNSTVTARAKNFHSVQYLLVHGTADDNVHFQQAAEISEALVEQQVDFEAMVSHLGEANGSVSFHEHVAFCALLSVVHGQGPRAGRLGLQTRLHTHEPLPPEVLCMSSTASLSKIVDTIFSFKCSLDY